jgi:superfamily II DNA or RNA helicase
MKGKLVLNGDNENVLQELLGSLNGCKQFYFNVAFVTYSGIQLLLEQLKIAEELGVKGNVVTSTYLDFTEAKAIRKIKTFSNIETRLFMLNKKGFHPKAYIFEYEDCFKIIIGSANITQSALKSNIEWNVSIISKDNEDILRQVKKDFDRIWKISSPATDELIKRYEDHLLLLKRKEKKNVWFTDDINYIKPNSMQENALLSLKRHRQSGDNKALVIAATGSGKTYMSAFDVANFNPEKMLFIVHREDILTAALNSFKKVITTSKDKKYGKLSTNHKDFDADYLFSTNISLDRNIKKFSPDQFEYIIIDEAHHVGGETYKRILEYFNPKFLLGMTATPERGDAQDIYETFDNKVAINIRLRDALEQDLIVPFHYFGITDAKGVDYSEIKMTDITEIARILQTNKRVEHVIEKMNFYGHEGDKRRGIGFCVSIAHAKFMTEEFNSRGIVSTYLTGKDKQNLRKETIMRLESNSNSLEMIFTVDIFNEGIDIPSVNTILMLRPTQSPIIFIQQLGRGLRKHESKSFVTILDFIGNYSKSFMLAIALNGRKYIDKDSLKVAIKNDFANLPGCTHIQLDKISKQQILNQIENENFNSFLYCKEEYLTFKLEIDNRIPSILDFFSIDGAPDPMNFLNYNYKSFLDFQKKVEGDNFPHNEFYKSDFALKLLRMIEDFIPVKRLVDFLAFKLIVTKGDFSKQELKNECLKHLNNITDQTLIHCLRFLAGDYFDKKDNLKYVNLGIFDENSNHFIVSENINSIILEENLVSIILDSIHYGIFRYENEFASRELSYPDLKLYSQYSQRNIALACNYDKKHSAFRGSTIPNTDNLTHKVKEYYLFIDLHKDEDATAYRDKFISESRFQWDSPAKTGEDTQQGIKIINHQKEKIDLHLFVRKFTKIDGRTQRFIYIGKGLVDSYEGTKPILFNMDLENRIPDNIYNELVTVK